MSVTAPAWQVLGPGFDPQYQGGKKITFLQQNFCDTEAFRNSNSILHEKVYL